IGDWSVTGVQTCALPILAREIAGLKQLVQRIQDCIGNVARAQMLFDDGLCDSGGGEVQTFPKLFLQQMEQRGEEIVRLVLSGERSEERRVGKEWRCGWGP